MGIESGKKFKNEWTINFEQNVTETSVNCEGYGSCLNKSVKC